MLHARFYTPIIQSRSYFSLGRKVGGSRLLVDGELVDRVFIVASKGYVVNHNYIN